jgi:hypothetical protein
VEGDEENEVQSVWCGEKPVWCLPPRTAKITGGSEGLETSKEEDLDDHLGAEPFLFCSTPFFAPSLPPPWSNFMSYNHSSTTYHID